MKSENMFKSVVQGVGVLMIAFFISGCFGGKASNPPENGMAQVESTKAKNATAVYLDFEDVLIPLELSVVADRSVIVSTPGFTSGILNLKGRVERRSLFNFFNTNMQKDNWNVISQIKSPGTTIMVFQKPTRTAVITIRDEAMYTYVEVGVAPNLNTPATLTEESLIE